MNPGLSIDQEARVVVCLETYGGEVEAAITSFPSLEDRMVNREDLEAAARQSGDPVGFFIAWLHRLTTDAAIRPLDIDLAVSWPVRPDPEDTALILALVADPRCWYYEVRVALMLTERVLDQGPVSASLVDGLLGLRARLEDDRLHSSEFFRAKALPWVRRLVASTTPEDVVDLAFIDPRDRWGAAVTGSVMGSGAPARVASALLHLGSPRGSRPSKAWWARTAAIMEEIPEMVPVGRSLLEAVTTIDVTPRDDDHDGWDVPDPFLLTPTNELVARGLAWAVRTTTADDTTVEVLGRVVLRSAAMVWVVPAHRMLCPKLALASVDTLMVIDKASARRQLTQLVGEIRSAPLVRRIGDHLGLDADALVASLRQRGPLPRP